MLSIRQPKHLAHALGVSLPRLLEVVDNTQPYYEALILLDPAKPDKLRKVVSVNGILRALQSRLYRRVLLPKIVPSIHSHGGVIGRHIKTNANAHLNSNFVFKSDISAFYPSIHFKRVYR